MFSAIIEAQKQNSCAYVMKYIAFQQNRKTAAV